MFFFPIQVNGRTCGVFAVNRFRGISRSLTSDLEILREVAVQIAQLLRLDQSHRRAHPDADRGH